MNIVEIFILARVQEILEDYADFYKADRSIDAGEWSDSLFSLPIEIEAAIIIRDTLTEELPS